MRILIAGASGQVGHNLVAQGEQQGFEVIGLNRQQLDITARASVQHAFADYQPDLVINAAAYTAVDKAETDADNAFLINELGARHLAEACAEAAIPLFHISSDYVFAGDRERPYTEEDIVAPSGVYARSKEAGERRVRETLMQHIILRTSWVFSAEGNNFVKTMLKLATERDSLAVVADQYGCPSSAASIAKTLLILASRYRSESNLAWGTYHFSNMPSCSWYTFACEIFRQAVELGLLTSSPVVNAIATADYPTPAKRPASSVLDCKKIRDYLSTELADWRSELTAVLKQLGTEK